MDKYGTSTSQLTCAFENIGVFINLSCQELMNYINSYSLCHSFLPILFFKNSIQADTKFTEQLLV